MKLIVIGSLLLSILASILFWGQTLGLNVFLFVLPVMCFIIFLLERYHKIKNRKGYWLILPILLLAITYMIYQNRFFQIMNLIVIFLLYHVMLIWLMNKQYKLEFLARRVFTFIFKPFQYIGKACKTIGMCFPKKENKKETDPHLKLFQSIILGIGISIPIAIVVVILLCSADDTFAGNIIEIGDHFIQWLRNIFFNNFGFTAFARLLIIVVVTIYFICCILNLLKRNPWRIGKEKHKEIQVESTIFNTILTILNLIYFAFCSIQIQKLWNTEFGANGFGYADFAREGFFQLMAVSIINFAMIIITTKNKKQSTKMQIYYRKIMNIILAIATIIILISAFVRMNLYGEAFGYTLLRILVYFALITEAILMIPTFVFICYEKFSPWKTYFVIVTVMYLVMNFSNINEMIAKQNVNRYLQNPENEIDVMYLTKTKTDGLEEVIKLYNQIENPILKQRLERYFTNLKTQLEQQPDNLLEWNYSRWKARILLEKIEIPENIEYNSYNNVTDSHSNSILTDIFSLFII